MKEIKRDGNIESKKYRKNTNKERKKLQTNKTKVIRYMCTDFLIFYSTSFPLFLSYRTTLLKSCSVSGQDFSIAFFQNSPSERNTERESCVCVFCVCMCVCLSMCVCVVCVCARETEYERKWGFVGARTCVMVSVHLSVSLFERKV